MACTRIPLSQMEWSPGGHPLENKKVGEHGIALLTFEPGFSDPNWCVRSHVIYVVQGVLELELRDRVERLETGDACWVEVDTEHRARNFGDVAAQVFVVSDVGAS